MSETFLCPQCRQPLEDWQCSRCSFQVSPVDGILDFISGDPEFCYLKEEAEYWDEWVDKFPTWQLRETIESVEDYFRGASFHLSARRMLPELRALDLRERVGLEVGGTGHCLAMMLKSGCRRLYHLEVSKRSQQIAEKNVSQLPFRDEARITYLCAPAERVPLPDNSVDFLMAFGTYHHTDRRQAVPEIHRILKPGGLFYIHEAYIGPALLPAKWLTRRVRGRYGFEPGMDNPLGLSDLSLLKRTFPVHRYEIRNTLDAFAFVTRYLNRPLAQRMYRNEMDYAGLTALATFFLKGILFFSGKKTAGPGG